MISFIIKLEDMLKKSEYEDWEIIYLPEEDGYILKLDGDSIFMSNVKMINNEYGIFIKLGGIDLND